MGRKFRAHGWLVRCLHMSVVLADEEVGNSG